MERKPFGKVRMPRKKKKKYSKYNEIISAFNSMSDVAIAARKCQELLSDLANNLSKLALTASIK